MSDGLIDVHTHVAPPSLPEGRPDVAGWPCMHCAGGKTTMMLGDKPFRELDARSWDGARRLQDMDADGVAIQVLSPMPELLSYWFSVDDAVRVADRVNGHIAEMVARNPARFRGLGMVPLQDPARAERYLETISARFGLIGVEIGSNIGGVLPGDARFHPFFAAAAAHDLAIFIHALHPVATKSVDVAPEFVPLVGFPLDVGMAGASLLLAGLLERHPGLRIALSHGGGALATVLGRLDQGWDTLPGMKDRLRERPSLTAQRLFLDSNVYEPRLLRYLATEIAPGRVCVGTDYPYLIMQEDPAAYIASSRLDAPVAQSVLRGAALDYLGMS